MKNEKKLTEEKNNCLKKSITAFSHSPHQPNNKNPRSAVINIAIPPSVEPARSGGLKVMCDATVRARYSHI